MKYVDFREILKIVAKAGVKKETVEIYYPKTEKTGAGWREVEPYSLTADLPPEGEHLIFGEDRLSPGHIFNAYTIKKRSNHCDSFIVGKIKMAKLTGKKFIPRNNWKVEFATLNSESENFEIKKTNLPKEQKKENIWNIPNALTFSRIIITFLVVFLIFAGFDIFYIVLAFVVGMLTDFFDGQIAKRFGLKTEFGRQFDMVADRFLMIGAALASIIKFSGPGGLLGSQLLQIFLILSREIISSPIIFVVLISGKGVPIPKARIIGKTTTVMQAFAFPMILLSAFYEIFGFSIYFSLVTSLVGLASSFYFTNDVKNLMGNKSQT